MKTERRRGGRRRFLLGAGAGAAGLTGGGALAQAPLTLRFQGAWSASDIYHEYALDYARRIEELSGGRLRLEMLPAGAVSPPEGMLDAVNRGALDGCHGVTRLWHARTPVASLFGGAPLPGMGAQDLLAWMEHGGGKALYAELFRQMGATGVTPFLYGPIPPQPFGWFRRGSTAGPRLKGAGVAAGETGAEILREMGAAPVSLRDEELAPALAAARIAAVQRSALDSDRSSGLAETGAACMLQSHHRPAEAFEVLFNRARYEALSAELRQLVVLATRAAGTELAWKTTAGHARAFEEMRAAGRVAFAPPSAELLRAQAHAWKVIAARRSEENPLFRKVHDSQTKFAKQVLAWRREAMIAPGVAYDHWFGRRGRSDGSRSDA